MYSRKRLIPIATTVLMMAACGGGGGGGTSSVGTPMSGLGVDGYLSGSAVYCDLGNTGVIDAVNDPVAYTQTLGKFTFPSGCTHQLLLSGGIDADTGLPFTGVLKAPAGSAVISPLTTLLADGMTQSQLNMALNLPAGTDVTKLDPAASSGGNLTNAALDRATLAVQQILSQASQALTSLGQSAGSATVNSLYAVTAQALVNTLTSGPPLIGSSGAVNAAVVSNVVLAAVTSATSSPLVDSVVKATLATFSPAAVAAVTAPTFANQANSILNAGMTTSSLSTAATAAQASTFVANFLSSNSGVLLTSAGTPASALASLGVSVASAAASAAAGNAGSLDTVLANLEESPALATGTFYGGADIIPAPSSGGIGHVLQIARGNGANYAGGWINTENPIAFTSTRKTISALVYSPVAGIPMALHVDALNAPHTIYTADKQANETVVQGWQTLTWTISDAVLTNQYQAIVLLPNLGTTAPASGEIYYYDNFALKSDAAPIVASNYVRLTNEGDGNHDTFTLVNGNTTSSFSMADFQSSAGISTQWPMASNATLSFSLSNVGNFHLSAGQTVNAAFEISQVGSGKGIVQGYVQNVGLTQSGNNLTVTVPTTGNHATVYANSTDSSFAAIADYSGNSAAGGVTSTLNINGGNTFNLGNLVSYTTNSLSSQFTGINALTGQYKITLVVTGLPLYQASGVIYPTMTINVPSSLTSGRAVQSTVPITGQGIVGYVTLTP
jgi:hypothetical protein